MNGEDVDMDLAEFLLARIAEDEAVARAVAAEHPSQDWDAYISSAGFYDGSAHVFAGRFDHVRVLAECEAKRRIVQLHRHAHDEGDGRLIGESWTCQECRETYPEWWCTTLRLLALPYADHPDYRSEWAP